MDTRSLRLIEAMNNDKVKISLSYSGGLLFEGYLKDEMGFSTSATYKSLLEKIAEDSSGLIGKINKFSEFLRGFTGNKLNDSSFSQVSWQNSDTGSMSFNIRVISTSYDINVIDIYKTALKMTLPIEENGKLTLKAPLGYSLLSEATNLFTGSGSNAITVKIGNYFNAPGAYVCTQLSGTFSKVLLKGTNRPLYVDLAITLQPRMTFNYQTVASWFTG